MARYAQGQPVRLSTEVKDAAGAYATPGTILLRVKKPDGTFLADYTSPVADAVGKYHVDVSATDAATLGHYQYAWITTGNAAGVSPAAAFEVVDPFAPTHITWSDVLEQLELTTATLSAGKQSELQRYMASAVAEQEDWVGAVAPRTVTESAYTYSGRLTLSTWPVMSVTSATLGGVAQTITSWTVPSPRIGLVDIGTSTSGQLYTVTYTAGRDPVPQSLVEAALLRVQHSYETQRGPGEAPFGEGAEGVGSTFALILRAQDKERPYLPRGVA